MDYPSSLCSHITGVMHLVVFNFVGCCDSAMAIRGLNTVKQLAAELKWNIIYQHNQLKCVLESTITRHRAFTHIHTYARVYQVNSFLNQTLLPNTKSHIL